MADPLHQIARHRHQQQLGRISGKTGDQACATKKGRTSVRPWCLKTTPKSRVELQAVNDDKAAAGMRVPGHEGFSQKVQGGAVPISCIALTILDNFLSNQYSYNRANRMRHPLVKAIAVFCAIGLLLAVMGDAGASSHDPCHCGMSQCGNSCCPGSGHQFGHAAPSCFCASLTALPGCALNFSILPSSSLSPAGNSPILRLFIPAIFHPPESALLLSS